MVHDWMLFHLCDQDYCHICCAVFYSVCFIQRLLDWPVDMSSVDFGWNTNTLSTFQVQKTSRGLKV